MQKIISYHPNKSTGIGGIETLIRSLQFVSISLNNTFFEYYNDIANDKKEHFHENADVIYKKIKIPHFADGQLREVIKGLLFAFKLKGDRSKGSGFVFIYHPIYLLFLFRFFLSEKKLIVVQSNRLDYLFSSRLAKLAFKLNGKNIGKFCVYTSFDRDKLEKSYNFNKEKIQVIPRGCKLESKGSVALYSKKLVTIARIYEHQKNFDKMIEVMKRIDSNYTLDIYGSGADEEVSSLKSKIANINNINYLGPTNNVAETLSSYSVFLMTSHYEGFGQTLIEARSQGLPLVVFNNFEAATWLIKQGENGFLINNNDVGDCVNKIEALTTDQATFNVYSNNCLKMADETDNEKVEKQWGKLLSE
tara:strand:- start:2863 stop:3945 length:1083 start_codon:yes stop_codon:yes gene_type:complete